MAAKNMPLMLCVVATLAAIPARAAELKPETAAFFDRYIRAVEARMDDDIRDNQFLVVDRLSESRREQAYAQLKLVTSLSKSCTLGKMIAPFGFRMP
jgi:hypothetical protein